MSTEDIELGPIDYVVVEWPVGKEPNGETRWQLTVAEYVDKELPMKIEVSSQPGSASAA